MGGSDSKLCGWLYDGEWLIGSDCRLCCEWLYDGDIYGWHWLIGSDGRLGCEWLDDGYRCHWLIDGSDWRFCCE